MLRKGVLTMFVMISVLSYSQVDSYLAGRACMSQQNYDSAIIHLEQALETNSGDVEILFQLGLSYYNLPNYLSAKEKFYEVEKRRTGMGSFYLAKIEVRLNHPQQALAKKQMSKGGALVTFELVGGIKRCIRFLDSLELLSLTSNLGDTRTIITHPASTTHSKLTPDERSSVNITEGLIRISVGLEHIDDIIADIEQAIVKSKK